MVKMIKMRVYMYFIKSESKKFKIKAFAIGNYRLIKSTEEACQVKNEIRLLLLIRKQKKKPQNKRLINNVYKVCEISIETCFVW